MPLPSSGQITLKGILDEKQGGTTARTNISLRGLSVNGVADSSGGDITGTPDPNAPHQMSEFHGFSAFSFQTPGTPTSNIWTLFTTRTVQSCFSKCKVGFQFRNTGASGGTVRAAFLRSSTSGNGLYDGSSGNESVLDLFDYNGADPASMQIRMTWTSDTSTALGGTVYEADDTAGNSWTNNSFRTIDSGTSDNFNSQFATFNNGDFTWGEWSAATGTANGTSLIRVNGTGGSSSGVSITARALDSGGSVIATSSTRVVPINLRADKESNFGGGP